MRTFSDGAVNAAVYRNGSGDPPDGSQFTPFGGPPPPPRTGLSADYSSGCGGDESSSARDYSSVYGASVMSAMSPAGTVTYGDWGEVSGHDPQMTSSSVLLRFSSAPSVAPEYALFAELEEDDLMMQVDRAYADNLSAPPTVDSRYRSSGTSADAKERLLQGSSIDDDA